MGINIVDKHSPRTYTALCMNSGIVLCTPELGGFITLRFREDIDRLKSLLEEIKIIELPIGDDKNDLPPAP